VLAYVYRNRTPREPDSGGAEGDVDADSVECPECGARNERG
jgi:hypothetical protein